jgi:hypothetical protein
MLQNKKNHYLGVFFFIKLTFFLMECIRGTTPKNLFVPMNLLQSNLTKTCLREL